MAVDRTIYPSTFRRRITVKESVATVDAGGGVSNASFNNLFTTWAEITSLKEQRKVLYGFQAFDSVFEIVMRYTKDRNIITSYIIDYLDGTNIISFQPISVQLVEQDYKKFNVIIAKVVSEKG